MNMLEAAKAWRAAGFSVVPVKTDGSKAPMGSWKSYQSESASLTDLESWFNTGHPGIGVVTGAVSGNLEMLEAEGRAVADNLHRKLRADLEAIGQGELWRRIADRGYVEQSPSGGFHYMYRVTGPVAGNTKLAQRPDENGRPTPLFETRGEAGFVVIAPSHGSVHPSGKPWFVRAGSPATIATITAEERDMLHAVARSFDEMPAPAPIPERVREISASPGDKTPGEDFNERGSWQELLSPHGWQPTYSRGDSTYWTRPGKSTRLGASAVTGGSQGDYMYVWSTSTELPSEQALSKWRVYAYLEHGGDFSAAAAALRREGYGTERPLPSKQGDGFDGIFTPSRLLETPDLQVADGAGAEGEPAPGGKFLDRLYSRHELRDLPKPQPLIEDTLDLETVAMIFGYWGSMKSFASIDFAASLATGKPWHGRRVARPGRVLYIAAEGAYGLNDRLTSWEKAWQSPIGDDKFSVLGAAPNLGDRFQVADICSLVKAEGFDYVFIDTFAKSVVGLDENSSKDMGIAVENLYRIQAASAGGFAMSVHHTGKDKLTSRGSSAIEAGVDTVYLTESIIKGETMKMSRMKRKDGPEEDELSFRLVDVEYTDSCILERIMGDDAGGLARQMAEIMTIYRDCFSATGCSKKELIAATMIPEQLFYRAFNALLEDGKLIDRGTPARPHYVSGE